MRLIMSGLIAAGMFITQTAGAVCISNDSREALDVEGLKTQLMVQTLTCKNDDEYNAFIEKFKRDLTNDERIAKIYFAKEYGRAGQTRQDQYMTNLANAKATASQKEGSLFCEHNAAIFKEVMALRNGAELGEYAEGRAIAQPVDFTSCEAAKPVSTGRRRPVRHIVRHR